MYVPLREPIENDSEGSTPVEDQHDDLPPDEKGKLKRIYVRIIMNSLFTMFLYLAFLWSFPFIINSEAKNQTFSDYRGLVFLASPWKRELTT